MVKTSVKDVDQATMVRATSAFLKKSDKIKEPEWTDLVKLGRHKELAPYDPDWFYTRVAAIARHLYVRSPTGVGALTKVFGGKQRRGVAPSHHVRSHRNCIRKALQELEKIKWVEKVPDSNGRRLTGTGRKDLDRIAVSIRNTEKEQ